MSSQGRRPHQGGLLRGWTANGWGQGCRGVEAIAAADESAGSGQGQPTRPVAPRQRRQKRSLVGHGGVQLGGVGNKLCQVPGQHVAPAAAGRGRHEEGRAARERLFAEVHGSGGQRAPGLAGLLFLNSPAAHLAHRTPRGAASSGSSDSGRYHLERGSLLGAHPGYSPPGLRLSSWPRYMPRIQGDCSKGGGVLSKPAASEVRRRERREVSGAQEAGGRLRQAPALRGSSAARSLALLLLLAPAPLCCTSTLKLYRPLAMTPRSSCSNKRRADGSRRSGAAAVWQPSRGNAGESQRPEAGRRLGPTSGRRCTSSSTLATCV